MRFDFNRRRFLKTSAALTLPMFIPAHVFGNAEEPGANDRIQVGLIGLGGRCQWICRDEGFPGGQVVAICDCFTQRHAGVAGLLPDGDKVAKYQYYTEMFEKSKLDCVFVETTTHARALTAIHAMRAGLDTYIEKPMSLTIAEGRAMVKAARKYNRITQVGSQQRSMPVNRHASKLVRDGAIGKVHTVEVCNFLPPATWTDKPGQPVPEGLDWDLWCNQTPLRPYHPEMQFGWATWRDYDNGGQSWGVTGWGTHSLDQVQCGLGTDDTGPVEIWPEEPGEQAKVTARYAGGTLLKLHGAQRGMEDLGAIFVGDKGKIEIKRGRFVSNPPELHEGAPPDTDQGPRESVPHIENFFACMRSRQPANADIEIGQRATTLCHLVTICRDLGRKLKWDPATERFDDEEANRHPYYTRPRRAGYELPDLG